MKDYEKVEGIIGIIDDGIKDACMQCDWAREARDGGDREGAMMFHTEAHKRLSAAKEWLETEYTGGFYLHDFPSTTYVPYCYAYDLSRLANEGLFFLKNYNLITL